MTNIKVGSQNYTINDLTKRCFIKLARNFSVLAVYRDTGHRTTAKRDNKQQDPK